MALIFCSSCKKSLYLDASPNNALVIPQTLSDYQAILDNDQNMNGTAALGNGVVPEFEFVGCDDYYTTYDLSSLGQSFENMYIWNDDIYSINVPDWSFIYRSVFYANEVLDGIPSVSITTKDQQEYNNLRGSALFYRAHAFYHAAQVYAPVFDSTTAVKDYGICLRLTSDINEPIFRASVKDTYLRIIEDLKESLLLLPQTPLYKTRPSKPASYALLAKVYLSIRDYNNSFLYADSCLQTYNKLIDYNTVPNNTASATPSFARFNDEVIFQALINSSPLMSLGVANVDTTLYNSYDSNDLRKSLFFLNGTDFGLSGYFFAGSYDGSYSNFAGLSTDETYLIRAEGYARQGNLLASMNDLTTLLQNRWVTGTFIPLTASSSSDALNKVLLERRKELLFRGTRWMDLRRLNKESENISIIRLLNGQTYTLKPNSAYYTYLIPPDVISFNPKMPQNPR
jgi:starch-binding outer membrane protein, SusD/RagB family